MSISINIQGGIMRKFFKKETWSVDMLKELYDHLCNQILPKIPFGVIEKRISTSFNSDTQREDHISYIGFIPILGLDDIYFGISSVDLIEVHENYIGFIEILNGIFDISDINRSQVPMIRGFIKNNIGFFEYINNIIVESMICNSRLFLTLSISLGDILSLRNKPADELLNKRLPIESIHVEKTISFSEWDDVLKMKEGQIIS
jgi:hypothetical protein